MPKSKTTKAVVATAKPKKSPVKKVVVASTKSKKVETEKAAVKISKVQIVGKTIKVSIVDVKGKAAGDMQLPEEMFGAKVNKPLLSQAIRVYLANQRQGNASTKTRGEVQASTRKIWRQKGTGRARHGSVKAPLFVGGGIAFGPRPHDFSLRFTKKMRKKALFSALSAKSQENAIRVVVGMEKLAPKTKEAALVLKNLMGEKVSSSVLLVTAKESENVIKATRNLPQVSLISYAQVNTYDVMKSGLIIIMKDAALQMAEHFLKGEHNARS